MDLGQPSLYILKQLCVTMIFYIFHIFKCERVFSDAEPYGA